MQYNTSRSTFGRHPELGAGHPVVKPQKPEQRLDYPKNSRIPGYRRAFSNDTQRRYGPKCLCGPECKCGCNEDYPCRCIDEEDCCRISNISPLLARGVDVNQPNSGRLDMTQQRLGQVFLSQSEEEETRYAAPSLPAHPQNKGKDSNLKNQSCVSCRVPDFLCTCDGR